MRKTNATRRADAPGKALRQVGRDTANPETREASRWAGDVAQYARLTRKRRNAS